MTGHIYYSTVVETPKRVLPRRCGSSAASSADLSNIPTVDPTTTTTIKTLGGTTLELSCRRVCGMGLPQDHGMAEILSETNLPYPAKTKQVVGEINGIVTDVTSISFSDRIMVTITQDGRLAQWVLYFCHSTSTSSSHTIRLGRCSPVRRKPHPSRHPPSTFLNRRRSPSVHPLHSTLAPRSW
jgi:hypothetical protein